jgi:hypothetical protein
MKLKVVLGTLVALFAVSVPAGAADVADLTYSWAPDLRCEDYSLAEQVAAHGVLTERFPTTNPDMYVEIHLYCATIFDEVLPSTDCTSTAYSLTGWRWTSAYSAKWDTTNPFGLSSSAVLSAMNSAGNTWDNSVGADIFGSMSSGGSSQNIRRQDFVNQQGFKGLGGGGTIAVTYTWAYNDGRAAESDAAYNTFYAWGTSGASNVMDLQAIGTHEMGHTFGMGHTSTASQNTCLTMYPYGNYGQTYQRTLGDGDIRGIDAIY